MSFDLEKLYSLLPAIYRVRDSEQGYPLKEFLSVIADQIAVLEEDLDQLYDDQFIETCAEWIVPYIGDLIGVRGIYDFADSSFMHSLSQRAQVANTIAYRRRKGTATVLEQLARDVTGWDAKVVEYFKLLATTQYMNHLRMGNLYSPDLRNMEQLEWLNTPFESLAHTADVRQIYSRRGKYNIPNIGIFLWRLRSYPLTESPAFKVDKRRYMFSPLGNNMKLFNDPAQEEEISHSSEFINVPIPISRCILSKHLDKFYGNDKSIFLKVDGADIRKVVICDLSDYQPNWAHVNDDYKKSNFLIDPTLGRIMLPLEFENKSPKVSVSFHYGFSADMGGGEYERLYSFSNENEKENILIVPKNKAKIQDAIDESKNGGVIEIENSGLYSEDLIINANCKIELRAANLCRPFLNGKISINADVGAEVILNGFLISGSCTLKKSGEPCTLRLRHCTLVPGITLARTGTPIQFSPSLTVEANQAFIEIDKCILGGMRVSEGSTVQITNSIIDATSESDIAYSALDHLEPGGTLRIENCTIIGKVHTRLLEYASNSIFLAKYYQENANRDLWGSKWPRIQRVHIQPVHSEILQQGCVRFCYLPLNSMVPRRYKCQPENEDQVDKVKPQFTSKRYGDPGYCQLSKCCPIEIRQGADDESEMGAFHNLFQPQREKNLRVRLEEYNRFGMETGIFYES
jgi:hypothetical protein